MSAAEKLRALDEARRNAPGRTEAYEAIEPAFRALPQIVAVLEAAIPLAETWDFHAADYLAELVDGAESRTLLASHVTEIIAQQKAINAALSALDEALEDELRDEGFHSALDANEWD